jgi:hypothetical protein
MLFLAPPSAPSVDGEDPGYDISPPDAPPAQRRRDGSDGRRMPARSADGSQRRRSSGGGPRTSGPRGASKSSSGEVKMTRGARRSATDFGISDDEVSAVLAAPHKVTPEQDHPDRTRFSGAGLTVVTGADGTVLHVSRRR